MANKVGKLIKEARTEAGYTQEQLAKKISGLTTADLGKAERGEKELTQAILKEIAKATGVTQASLINAAKSSTYSEKKTTTGKTSSSTSKKKETDFELTAAEKKLVELYRKADKEDKAQALKVLKGEEDEEANDILSSMLNGVMDLLGKK